MPSIKFAKVRIEQRIIPCEVVTSKQAFELHNTYSTTELSKCSINWAVP